MFFEGEGKIYDKYSYNHIRLHKNQDRQMEKVIELLMILRLIQII